MSLLLFSLFILFSTIKCQEYQYKCEYKETENNILCDANHQDFNITLEFLKLSTDLTANQKVLNSLQIQNSSIYELPENSFEDLAFQSISIFDAQNLSLINTNAFSGQMGQYLTDLTIESPTQLEYRPPDNDLFKALNSLNSSQQIIISLKDNGYHYIPDNAFSNAQDLKTLVFTESTAGQNKGYTISTIGSKSFSGLSKLTSLSFENIFVRKIRFDSFNIDVTSTERLTINLQHCLDLEYVLEDTIEPNCFTGANRPVTVDLEYNDLQYIREKKFKSFLDENKQNILLLGGNYMNCYDIEPFIWIVVNKANYQDQIVDAFCYDGTSIWDLDVNSTTPVSSTIGGSSSSATIESSGSSTSSTSTTGSPPTTPSNSLVIKPSFLLILIFLSGLYFYCN